MENIIMDLVKTVIGFLKADWYILLIGILMAVSISVYVDSDKLKRYLERNSKLSIPGSVVFGAFTPLCACGTMAVLLSMFISSMPWGPVMAFLISSPLTSPSEFMFDMAFFGTRFAIAVLVSSIFLGLTAGFIAHQLETKTNFFHGQFKLKMGKSQKEKNQLQEDCSCDNEIKGTGEASGCCSMKAVKETKTIGCCSQNSSLDEKSNFIEKYKIKEFAKELYNTGFKKILLYFILFITIGRAVEMAIPKEWVLTLFSGGKSYSIPLAATIGLPLYVSGPAALPLMRSFMNSGAGEGAILAFLITGKATGVPVIAGMSTILKKRAILFYIAFIYLGGILSGYAYQILLNF